MRRFRTLAVIGLATALGVTVTTPSANAVERSSADVPCVITVGVEKDEKPLRKKNLKSAIKSLNKHVSAYQFQYNSLPAGSVSMDGGSAVGTGADVYVKSLGQKRFQKSHLGRGTAAYAGYMHRYIEEAEQRVPRGYVVLGPRADSEKLTLHELGHIADLDHGDDRNSVMYPFVSDNSKLTKQDIRSLKSVQEFVADRYCPISEADEAGQPGDSDIWVIGPEVAMPHGGRLHGHTQPRCKTSCGCGCGG